MKKREVLTQTTFGKTTAEEESLNLSTYFVETVEWRKIWSGEADVLYGPKGSGKSAIYALLLNRRDDLAKRGVIVVAAENPRGALVFQDLATDPPANEEQFRSLWKLYFLQLAGDAIRTLGFDDRAARSVTSPLVDAGLLPNDGTLSAKLRSARDYVRKYFRPSAVETNVEVDPITQLPKGFSGKITFREPDEGQRKLGMVSADGLLRTANELLEANGKKIWLALDRLDVAFAESALLEGNALRALFRTFLDLRGLDSISLKIFLRSDIWKRISEEGFREASHISGQTIKWNEQSLLNLVVSRALSNQSIREFYQVEEQDVLSDEKRQEDLFYKIFPKQIDSGERKPKTLYWMLKRTCDGTGLTAPRELIHLLTCARDGQLKKFDVGGPEPTEQTLIDRSALKEALPEVSRARIEQTLYAEFPDLRKWIAALGDQKTAQSKISLSKIWKCDDPEAESIATRLVEVGFFEPPKDRDNPVYQVPFLYRSWLKMSQGKA